MGRRIFVTVTAAFASACISAQEHDALRERNQTLARDVAAEQAELDKCERRHRATVRTLNALRTEHHAVAGQRAALRHLLVEQKATESQRSARAERQARRIARLEALLRKRARVYRLRARDVRRGKLLALLPGEEPRGPLAAHLEPSIDAPLQYLELTPDAVLELERQPVSHVTIDLAGDTIAAVELRIEADQNAMKALMDALCPSADGESCDFEASPWRVAVRATQSTVTLRCEANR